MKILQVGKYYSPYRGGIETVVQALSEGLRERGHEVTVLCSAHDSSASVDQLHGVKVIRARCHGVLASQPIAPGLIVETIRSAEKFDLIHFHSPHPFVELASVLMKKRCPFVFTYHSDVIRQRLLLPFYRPLIHRALARADRIIVPTVPHLVYSPILPRFKDKCAVIPFGLPEDVGEIGAPVESRLKDLESRKKTPLILFVGRLVGYKGVRYLVEAMQEVQARLVIVGEGPLRSELIELAKEKQVSDRVEFLGKVEDEDQLKAYYHACDLFVLPSISRNEAFGMVLLEAMACSKPLITARIESGVRFVNEDGKTGVEVNPADPADLARAIRGLLSDPERRLSMGRQAQNRFKEQFTLRRMIERYCEVYDQVCVSAFASNPG